MAGKDNVNNFGYLFYSTLVAFQINELTVLTSFVVKLLNQRIILIRMDRWNSRIRWKSTCMQQVTCSKVLIRLHLRHARRPLNSSGISAVIYSSSSIIVISLFAPGGECIIDNVCEFNLPQSTMRVRKWR